MATRKISQLNQLTTALNGNEFFEIERDDVTYRISSYNLFKVIGILTSEVPEDLSGYRIPLFKISDGQPYSCTLDQLTSEITNLPSGGIEGQSLSKASDLDQDVEWATPALMAIGPATVDLKTTVAVSIGTTSSSLGRFIPSDIIVLCTEATSIGTPAAIGVGVTGAAYTDLLSATLSASFDATNESTRYQLPWPLPAPDTAMLWGADPATQTLTSVAASTQIFCKPQSAISGTSQTVKVWVRGFYAGA